LNPHNLAIASTSTYSSHSIPPRYNHLRATEECDRASYGAQLGTNASHRGLESANVGTVRCLGIHLTPVTTTGCVRSIPYET